MIRPEDIRVVAWDFDGVLNRNVQNGVFAWSRSFAEDLGLSLDSFSRFLFQGRFQKAMVGEACLKELVTEWAGANGAVGREGEILDYWFTSDALPDADVLAMLAQLRQRGIANVMATNNEIHRTAFIESEMGFDRHMDRIFAAGRMRIISVIWSRSLACRARICCWWMTWPRMSRRPAALAGRPSILPKAHMTISSPRWAFRQKEGQPK